METLAKYHSLPRQIPPIPLSSPKTRTRTRTKTKPLQVTFKIRTTAPSSSSSTEDDEWNPSPRRRRSRNLPTQTKSRRRLITISTSADGRWNDKWTSDYIFSLEELRLSDLAEDGHKDAEVFITLTIEKHASFGFSVHGKIITSFNGKCINCTSSYCRKVIYVKPGSEADLDSLIQDTIRLTTSVKETCSEKCEKSEQRWQCIISPKEIPAVDGRWSTLLKLKKKAT